MTPYYQDDAVTIYHGDCLAVMAGMPDASIDAIVTDPPYGLSFMGKGWDHGIPGVEFWHEALRVAKPGAHLLAFGGTRTFHRLACAIEDAGWEIRDDIAFLSSLDEKERRFFDSLNTDQQQAFLDTFAGQGLRLFAYGSGFPKSADVSKMLDKQEKNIWMNARKSIDSMSATHMLDAWKEYSRIASGAGLLFAKSGTAIGTNTQKSDSVPAPVLLTANHASTDAAVIIAELSLIAVHHTIAESGFSVLSNAENSSTESSDPAIVAASTPASREVMLFMLDSSVLQSAWGWHAESTVDNLKAVEALKIWLGKTTSSSKADTDALCAALTEDLKRIILSQSKTFQNYDTIRQTGCVSAISATITESTAENLISFMVATLRNKAIDKAAGAEREVVGVSDRIHSRGAATAFPKRPGEKKQVIAQTAERGNIVTAPATEDAKRWHGWGTAAKPAWEPIIMARKPFPGTVAANVLKYGTGAINIDGCRVGFTSEADERESKEKNRHEDFGSGPMNNHVFGAYPMDRTNYDPPGRWPANLVHDGSEEVLSLFPVTKSDGHTRRNKAGDEFFKGKGASTTSSPVDSGSAARFFYTAKASGTDRGNYTAGEVPLFGIEEEEFRNTHPTVKPTELMEWLVKLVTPPGGTVLDMFAGSGTTGVAVKRLGFTAILVDITEEYCAIAAHRCSRSVLF